MTKYDFTDLSTVARRAMLATCVFAAMQLLFSVVNIYQNVVIRRYIDGIADDQALTQSDTIVTFASIILLVVLIIVYTVNGRFLYLASRNAAAITPDPTAITPGWAVGWYAVPFANFWMPFSAMKQTWTRTFGSTTHMPQWLIIWWLSWVGMNIYDRVLGRLPAPNNLPDYIGYNQVFIASGFLWLIPSFFFLRIIRTLARARHNPADVFA